MLSSNITMLLYRLSNFSPIWAGTLSSPPMAFAIML